ncbi:Hypothetical predicted protein [Mytilus galloprovincialis]|uniref:Mutator-like transposase domain-containing protein n=1 Tax=Mytilus galloprovincialis TaxID=29158 RepID=A0A8B6E3A3_MYTGA|nr:Hypothetical predicted protein [Mytilus galloprovincialis]
MIHAGLGYAQIRNFLTECNLPVMSKSCFQKHEKKIGKIFVSAADHEESCKNAQQLEKEISADKGGKKNNKERRLNIHESVSYQSEVATIGLSDTCTEAITIPSPLKMDGT